MEDKFSLFDATWLSSLRDRAKSCYNEKVPKKLSKKPLESTVPNPPSFYESDMQKWGNKFKDAVKERLQYKKKYLKNTKVGLEVRPEDKIMQLVQSRRKSRLSSDNFTVMDFEPQGKSLV